MSKTLTEKLQYIDSKVPMINVLSDLYNLHYDQTQQINCPFHNDATKSARVYVRSGGAPDPADAVYCWVCGNKSASGLAIHKFQGIPKALQYFEEKYHIDFREETVDTIGNDDLAEIVKKCKEHSKKYKWGLRQINLLSHLIRNFDNSILTDIRLLRLKKAMKDLENGKST